MRAPDPDGAGSGNYTPPPRLGHINIGYLDDDPIGANDGDLYYNVNSKGLRVYDWADAEWKQISNVRIVGAAPYGNVIYYQGQFAWNTAEKTLYVANSTTANAGPTGYWDWRPAVNLSSYAPLSSPIFEGNPQFGVANNVTVDFGVGTKSATINMSGTLNIANYSNITFAYASPGIYFKNGNATPGSTKLTYSYSGPGNIVLNLPNNGGNLVGTGDTGTVTNAMLANSSITINGTAVQLGGSTTITSAVTSVDGNTGAVSLTSTYVPQTRNINTTSPLNGGGALSSNLTLSVSAASTTSAGVVQLTDSVNSTSTTTAATPNSVKTAYDLAAAAAAGAPAGYVPTYIQATKPTTTYTKYMWWDNSSPSLTLWIEDGT